MIRLGISLFFKRKNERNKTCACLYQKRIAEAREEYRPVAARGAISYFLVSEFSSVNCMYHTSLAQFADVYDRSIDNSERAAMPAKRISNIVDYLTRELHDYVSRGLFEEHKLTFSLLLAIKILQQEGRVDPRALNTFCKGGKALDITQVSRWRWRWRWIYIFSKMVCGRGDD